MKLNALGFVWFITTGVWPVGYTGEALIVVFECLAKTKDAQIVAVRLDRKSANG